MLGVRVRGGRAASALRNSRLLPLRPLTLRLPVKKLGLAAFIILVLTDEEGQDALIVRTSDCAQVRPIFLAGTIAQDLQRFALPGFRAAGCGQPPVKCVNGWRFRTYRQPRRIRCADLVGQRSSPPGVMTFDGVRSGMAASISESRILLLRSGCELNVTTSGDFNRNTISREWAGLVHRFQKAAWT